MTNTFWAPLLLQPRHGAIYVDVQRMPRGQMKFYRRAARLRANSSAVAQAIVAEAPRLQARVAMIPNPLPFVPSGPVNWAAKEKLVLFAGRLHPEKGIELLLQAWTELRAARRLDGWRLELLGPTRGSEGGGGEDWADGLRRRFARDDIAWRAPVYDAAELNRVYARAGVFAYPSLAAKGETFGLAILEAMAWGAVPVVSDLACFRDFVEAGSNGLIFVHDRAQASTALATALEQAAQPAAQALARHATRVRESHSVAAIAGQFIADFASLTRVGATR